MPTDPAPLVLALSPHLDDAVFSCGGTLARLAATGWRVVVATLFTASVPDPEGFALSCQLDKGLDASVDYMALRRGEDAAACALLGATPCWLPFPEAPHRGYHSAPALFEAVLPDDPVQAPLVDAIRGLIAEHRPALLLAPQAIGGHVDHVVTVWALERARPAMPVLWWQDYPYVARAGAVRAPFAEAMSALAGLPVAIAPQPKQAACEAYASQLGFQFGGFERLATALAEAGPFERFRHDRSHALPAELQELVAW